MTTLRRLWETNELQTVKSAVRIRFVAQEISNHPCGGTWPRPGCGRISPTHIELWGGFHVRLTQDHIAMSVEVRELGASIGQGLFLREPVRAGQIVVIFGGFATPTHQFLELPLDRQHHAIQVADDVYLVGEDQRSLGDYVNHSCDPTTHLVGEITLAAARDLAADEQLTYDYATSDSTPYDEFECECGSPRCRGKVTGEDWMDPAFQERYRGFFSPYLQRRIDALRADTA
jgi:hypothetical protein